MNMLNTELTTSMPYWEGGGGYRERQMNMLNGELHLIVHSMSHWEGGYRWQMLGQYRITMI